MKTGRYLKIDAGEYKFLTGEKIYSWPLDAGFLLIKMSTDLSVDLYLVDSVDLRYFPLTNGCSYHNNLQICGFDQLVIKCTAKTLIAICVDMATQADLDPLDYTPVEIAPPAAQTERDMLEIVLDRKLQSMGISTDGDEPEDDTEDLDFYDDEPELPETIFDTEGPQPEAEPEPVTEQPEPEENPSSNPQQSEVDESQPDDAGSKDEPAEN